MIDTLYGSEDGAWQAWNRPMGCGLHSRQAKQKQPKIGVLCGFHHISNSVKVHQLSGEHVSIASHTIFWPQTRLAFLKQNDR